MKRIDFIKSLAVLPLAASVFKLNALEKFAESMMYTEKMPLLFLGHGSPMNAIEDNEFVKGFRNVSSEISKPKAILCISAHWETKGTQVTAMSNPKTIHDFGGFPKELFNVQYPAPGDPILANETKGIIKKTEVLLNESWGLDHGAWSVIKHMYPDADIPVVQMSLDYNKTPQYHYELAKELASLRSKGVLIVGSGNMIHNLGMIAWNKMKEDNYGYDWAIEANEKMKLLILNGNHSELIDYQGQGKSFQLSIPSPEHYLPLLYILALKEENEKIDLFNEKMIAGSLSMTSLKIGE